MCIHLLLELQSNMFVHNAQFDSRKEKKENTLTHSYIQSPIAHNVNISSWFASIIRHIQNYMCVHIWLGTTYYYKKNPNGHKLV